MPTTKLWNSRQTFGYGPALVILTLLLLRFAFLLWSFERLASSVSRGFPRSGLASFHEEYYYEFFGLSTHIANEQNMVCTKQNMRNVFGGQSSCIPELHATSFCCKHQHLDVRYCVAILFILNITHNYDRGPGLFFKV